MISTRWQSLVRVAAASALLSAGGAGCLDRSAPCPPVSVNKQPVRTTSVATAPAANTSAPTARGGGPASPTPPTATDEPAPVETAPVEPPSTARSQAIEGAAPAANDAVRQNAPR